MRWNKEIHTTIILLIVQITSSRPTSNNAPAVFEVINEQARMDEKRVLPYSNPLAGNSNAKLHAQHQQAMFTAERIRQHRAQLQRWQEKHTRQQVDSYMKAYQESQENHHLALEQMQTKSKERKTKIRPERQLKDLPEMAPVKITRGDAIDKNRNHRSYGSVYTAIQKNHNFNVHPAVIKGYTFDQGITIKPNGNLGSYNFEKEHKSLYTAAIPSKTHYVYPKVYNQMHGYQSANDINTLQTLIKKSPQDQLTQLNTLIPTTTYPDNEIQDKPMDLYYYVNHPHVDNIESTHIAFPGLYAAHYINHKDHKPITEEIQDIPDINDSRIRTYLKPATPTMFTQVHDSTMATENYFKIEHEHPVSKNLPKNVEYVPEEKPKYETFYHKPKNTHQHRPSSEGVKYLQSQPTRVQHISQDGSETSAYGDEDIHYAANYEFGYRVRDHETGNDFGHQEEKSGDNTRGQYHVLLPDGRMQQVRYSAGPGGFHADISYDHLQDDMS